MELTLTIFGTTLEIRIGATVEEDLTPALDAKVEHFGFVPVDPAFPEFEWEEDV